MAGRPVFHLLKTVWNDRNNLLPVPAGKANDASHLNEAPVAEIWKIPDDPEAAEKQMADLLKRARESHLKVSIAGAAHSMGGHTIYSNGIVVDMLPFHGMELDEANRILHVQAGARWHDVIRFLNARGLSVEVMQSNDDFSVGGSLSVNCHGWQFNRPPIDSTVESFRLMRADGVVVRCSRTENPELFSLVLGGYGLFGIILDTDLRIVPNEQYRLERVMVPASDFIEMLDRKTRGSPDVAMVYGRLRVTREKFLEDSILNVFHRLPSPGPVVSSLGPVKNAALQRAILRGGVGDEYGKQLRWDAEKDLAPMIAGNTLGRNEILYEPSDWFSGHDTNATDILVECFTPPGQFAPLLAELRKIIPLDHGDLLNLTIREVNRDDDSFLRYADKRVISSVMLFSQERTPAGEATMSKLTQDIVAATLRHEGRYYLPYRLHATPAQFNEAYPQAQQFFGLKKKYDPEELFQNGFYVKYGK